MGLWLRASALQTSLVSDDWDHYAMDAGVYPNQRAAWDYYNFVSSDDGERRALLDSGRLPWWSDPKFHLAFFRPLSSLSLWADYAVASTTHVAALAHGHSAAWWVLGALAVAALLRQLLSPEAALLATLLYALDDAHALPMAWTASRSELIAVALMTWALWAHLEWKRRGLVRYRVAALGLVGLGLLSGEHALAMSAFLIACELGAQPAAPLRARLQGLLPLLAPVVIYVVVRTAMGYGVVGSTFYADPFREPGRYVRALVHHVPLLAGDLGLGYPADYWYAFPPWRDALKALGLVPQAWLEPEPLQHLQQACGVIALGGTVIGWIALGKRGTSPSARSLRWLLAGALLALVPLSGALPMTRLTVGPSIAFHAAFAWLAIEAWRVMRSSAPRARRMLAGACVVMLLAVHGVGAAARGRGLVEHYAHWSRVEAQWITRSAALNSADLSGRHVLVLSAIDAATSYSLPFVRRFAEQSVPLTSEQLLPPYLGSIWLLRVSRNVLELGTPAADGFSELRRSAYWREDRGLEVGQKLVGPRFSVFVMATEGGMPSRLRFVFARPLEDASYLFVQSTPDGLKPLALPKPGEVAELAQPSLPRAL